MPFIDGFNGRALLRVAREEHAHAFGSCLAGPGQELGAVHARHAHVGNDDGVRPFLRQRLQSLLAAGRRVHHEAAACLPLVAGQHVGIVVDAKDFFAHATFPRSSARQVAPGVQPRRQAKPLDICRVQHRGSVGDFARLKQGVGHVHRGESPERRGRAFRRRVVPGDHLDDGLRQAPKAQ